MINIDLSSKRAQLALRFFTYGVMTVATITLTALAIFYAMGYRFNQNQLSFDQGGLVQFRSVPQGAGIVIDGKTQNLKTPDRANVAAGQHTIEMRMTGYHTWKKTVNVSAGQLLWLNYTRMVPLSVKTSPARIFSAMHAVKASPDKHWLLIQERQNDPIFTLADISGATPTFTTLRIPDVQLTRPSGTVGQVTIVEWDAGSRYVLLRHDNAGVSEYLRLDRTRPEETINISQKFALTIADAHFAGNNANALYARTDDILRRLDVSAGTVSAALVSGVRSFSVSPDSTLLFTAERAVTPGDLKLYAGLYQQDKEILMRSYPIGTRLLVDHATYFSHDYIAINAGGQTVHVLRDPTAGNLQSEEFATFELDMPLDKLEFNDSGRMLLAANGGHIAMYDLELDKTYHSVLHTEGSPTGLPSWLDDFYIWHDVGGVLHIVEFDGQNGHDITPVARGMFATISTDGKFLYSIKEDKTTQTFLLQASHMTKQTP